MTKEHKNELVDEITNYTLNLLINDLISYISQTEITEFYIAKDEIKFKTNDETEQLDDLITLPAQAVSLYLYQSNINDPVILYRDLEEEEG